MLSLFLWCLERMYSILVSPIHTYGAFMVEGTAESIPLGDVDSFPSAVRVNIGANDPDMTVPFTGERSIRDCYYSLQLLDMSDTNPFSKDVVEYNDKRVKSANGKATFYLNSTLIPAQKVLQRIVQTSLSHMPDRKSLVCVVPDYFDSQKRRQLIGLLREAAKDANPITLINLSLAAVYSTIGPKPDAEPSVCLSIRFDDGPLQVSAYSVRPNRILQLASFTAFSVSGVRLLNDAIKCALCDMDEEAKEEFQSYSSSEQLKISRKLWFDMWNYLSDPEGCPEPTIDLDYPFQMEMKSMEEAMQSMFVELDNAIANCLLLGNISEETVSHVSLSGELSHQKLFQNHMMECYPNREMIVLDNDLLCRKALEWASNPSIPILQCLPITLTLGSKDSETIVICDSFTPYPCSIQKVSHFPRESVPNHSLLMYYKVVGSPGSEYKEPIDLSDMSTTHNEYILTTKVDIDANGVCSVTTSSVVTN